MPSKSLSQATKSSDVQAKTSPSKHSNKIPSQDLKKTKSQLSPSKDNQQQLQLFKENSLFDNFFKDSFFSNDMVSIFDPLNDFSFNKVQNLFDNMSKKMEEEFHAVEEMIENPPALEDPEHTSCYMKVMKNDNGHVQIKATKKVPGSEWETYKKEYYQKKRPVLKRNSDMAIEN